MKSLSIRAKKEFLALGLLEETVALKKDHSTIFNIKGDDEMFEHLTKIIYLVQSEEMEFDSVFITITLRVI